MDKINHRLLVMHILCVKPDHYLACFIFIIAIMLNLMHIDIVVFQEYDEVNPEFPNFNFNTSHHGDYVAISSEPLCLVGLDIVSPIIPISRERGNSRIHPKLLTVFLCLGMELYS